MERIRVEICSPPDREKLVAAIMVDREQFAEIEQESEQLRIEIYSRRDALPWGFDLEELSRALGDAKRRLTG